LEKFLETFSIAAILIIIALLLIGLSWLLTGKQKIKGGTCGRDPTKKQDKSCGTKVDCQLCDRGEEKEEPKEQNEKEDDDE
jgi:hypothetical protein